MLDAVDKLAGKTGNRSAVMSLPKAMLTDYVGMLGAQRLAELKRALRIALAVE